MNLGMFDNIDGMILRERENSLGGPVSRPGSSTVSGSDMSAFPSETPLAMAYVPFQSWGSVRSAEEALECGTLFPALDFPFTEGGKMR